MNIKKYIASIMKTKDEKEKRNRPFFVESPIVSDEDDIEDNFWIELNQAIPDLEDQIAKRLEPQIENALISCKNNGFNHYEIFWVHENGETHCAVFRPNPICASKTIVVERLWVCSFLRRRGLGKAIISCIEEAGRCAGYDGLYVIPDGYNLTEREDSDLLNAFPGSTKDSKEVSSQDRITFYEKCGFEKLENDTGTYVEMWKLIGR